MSGRARYLAAARMAALALLATAASPAGAHPMAPRLLEIRELAAGEAVIRWKTPPLKARGTRLEPRLPESCRAVAPQEVLRDPLRLEQRWTVRCAHESWVGQRVGVDGLERSPVDVLLRIELADGRSFRSVLTRSAPHFLVPQRERALGVFAGYARLGVEHILAGADHLALVLGLVLLIRGRRRLLLTVTAFTAGHSVTLALASLGWVALPPAPIEILIAASIVLLGLEMGRAPRSGSRFSLGLAAAFGLLHGLGFAGALREVGLPETAVPLALFAFNVGIELGQLAFIACVLGLREGLAGLLARRPAELLPARGWAATGIGALGVFWVFQRLELLL